VFSPFALADDETPQSTRSVVHGFTEVFDAIRLDGMYAGLQAANAAMLAQHRLPLFCEPPDARLSLEELETVVATYKERHAVDPAFPPELTILVALELAYPCTTALR
jgi:hypothetical protein